MKKRSRLKQNLQCRAFDLFSKGWNIYEVSGELQITISDARKYHKFFLNSEQVPAERSAEITEFFAEGLRKEREICINDLANDLIKRKEDEFATPEKIQARLEAIFDFFSGFRAIEEILFYFGKSAVPVHWLSDEESRLLDNMNKVCNN